MANEADLHRKCKDCKWYSEYGSECHRHAPTCDKDGHSGWPYTALDSWCGDWEWGGRRAKPCQELVPVKRDLGRSKGW